MTRVDSPLNGQFYHGSKVAVHFKLIVGGRDIEAAQRIDTTIKPLSVGENGKPGAMLGVRRTVEGGRIANDVPFSVISRS